MSSHHTQQEHQHDQYAANNHQQHLQQQQQATCLSGYSSASDVPANYNSAAAFYNQYAAVNKVAMLHHQNQHHQQHELHQNSYHVQQAYQNQSQHLVAGHEQHDASQSHLQHVQTLSLEEPLEIQQAKQQPALSSHHAQQEHQHNQYAAGNQQQHLQHHQPGLNGYSSGSDVASSYNSAAAFYSQYAANKVAMLHHQQSHDLHPNSYNNQHAEVASYQHQNQHLIGGHQQQPQQLSHEDLHHLQHFSDESLEIQQAKSHQQLSLWPTPLIANNSVRDSLIETLDIQQAQPSTLSNCLYLDNGAESTHLNLQSSQSKASKPKELKFQPGKLREVSKSPPVILSDVSSSSSSATSSASAASSPNSSASSATSSASSNNRQLLPLIDTDQISKIQVQKSEQTVTDGRGIICGKSSASVSKPAAGTSQQELELARRAAPRRFNNNPINHLQTTSATILKRRATSPLATSSKKRSNSIHVSATYKDVDIEHTDEDIKVTNLENGREVKLTNHQLTTYSVRRLNQIVNGFPRQTVTKLKQRRRTLKNRGYAQNCRHKRLDQKNKLELQNEELRKEVMKLREKLQIYSHELSLMKRHLNVQQQQNSGGEIIETKLLAESQLQMEARQLNHTHHGLQETPNASAQVHQIELR